MDLFFACMGNGVSVSDRSRNHQSVCHISIHGHVQFYLDREEIPAADLERIFAMAKTKKAEFMDMWNKKSFLDKYIYMMAVPTIGCGFNAFTEVEHKNRHLSVEERVRLMEPVFFGTHM